MSSVQVTRGEADQLYRVVATDARKLVMVNGVCPQFVEEADPAEPPHVLVHKDAFAAGMKLAKKGAVRLDLGQSFTGADGASIPAPAAEGRMPDFMQLFQGWSNPRIVQFSFCPHLLADVLLCLAAMGVDRVVMRGMPEPPVKPKDYNAKPVYMLGQLEQATVEAIVMPLS